MSETIRATVLIDGTPQEMDVTREQKGFDPMTGQPVMEITCRKGFDPMTGQPVYIKLAQNGFDTMTGKPLFKPVDGSAAPAPSMQPPMQNAYGMPAQYDSFNQPVPPARRSGGAGKFLPFIIGGGALLVVAIIVVAGILSGAFLSKRDKIAMAAYKTANDSTIGKVMLDSAKVFGSNELSANIAGEVSALGYDVQVDGTMAYNTAKGQADIDAVINAAGVIDQEIELYYDDSIVALSLPDLTDEVYFYDYTSSNDGYLADAIESYTEGDIEDINTILASSSKMMKKSGECNKKLIKAIKKAYKGVEVNSIDSETLEVDGKDRKCKGYEMIITGDNIADFVYAVSETSSLVYDDEINDIMDAIGNLTGEDLSRYSPDNEDFYDELADEFSGMGDLSIYFYIYGGKLAAICTDAEGMEMVVEFKGGDNRCSNIAITANFGSGSQTVELESAVNGNTEEGTIYCDDTEIAYYEYNKKTGTFEIDADGLGDFDGTFKADGHEIEFTSDFSVGVAGADISFTISDNASIKEPKGGYVDIGNVDETDLMDIVYGIGNIISNSRNGLW